MSLVIVAVPTPEFNVPGWQPVQLPPSIGELVFAPGDPVPLEFEGVG